MSIIDLVCSTCHMQAPYDVDFVYESRMMGDGDIVEAKATISTQCVRCDNSIVGSAELKCYVRTSYMK